MCVLETVLCVLVHLLMGMPPHTFALCFCDQQSLLFSLAQASVQVFSRLEAHQDPPWRTGLLFAFLPSFLPWEVPMQVRANPAMLFLRRELSTSVLVVAAAAAVAVAVILVLCEEQNIYPAMASSGQGILDSHKPPQL